MKSINPHTLELISEYEEDSDELIQQKLELSQNIFGEYRHSSHEDRRKKMLAVAANLRKNSLDYAIVLSMEMGKPVKEAVAEVEKCAWACEYYAENAEEFLGKEKVKTDADQSYVTYEPLGVILGVMPWNFPFWQAFRFAVPTIMAGNTVVLKHASNVQGSARLIEKIFLDSGFQKGIFQNLGIGSDKVEGILKNDIVKAASVTGSEKAGSAVAKICGEQIKPVVLELGGSNAFIVLKDADISFAAKLAVKARMINNAQSCIAAKRFILEKEIAQDFICEFEIELKKLKSGNPLDEDTQVGPLARVDLAEKLEDQLQRSREMGAILLHGGKRKDAYFEPTIITDVKPGMPAFDEELFGPVAAMIIAENADEAIDLANNSRFGLGASIVTKDIEKGKNLALRIEDGAVFINELVKSDPRLPFGGTKKSGFGRELSKWGIHEFVNVKTLYVHSL